MTAARGILEGPHSQSGFFYNPIRSPFMSIDSSHPGLGLKNRKILIIADDRSKALRLREILAADGYVISSANSAEAALRHYWQFEPELVLLDAGLTGSNVFDVCRSLKGPNGGGSASVIIVTSRSDTEELVAGMAAGAVDYLPMPFREKEVLARVRVHMRNHLRLAELDRADKAKDRSLTVTAHDLRNPATAIRALAHTLRSRKHGPVSPEQLEVLNTIYEVSESMLNLVNSLLDTSARSSVEVEINPQPTSLPRLVEEAVRLNSASAAPKGTAIVVITGDLPERMVIDGPKIRQVLDNLLGNAVKFSPAGSTVTLEVASSAGVVSIAVRDQGPGIPEGEHERLFRDYGRTSALPTAGEPSTGLGLSICRDIILAHNGAIRVDNLPGGGAEFLVTFPAS
jgi:two-component system sensor histidine kinase/response regulator